MERVLMALCFVFVLEAIVAVLANVLLFHLVDPKAVALAVCPARLAQVD